MHGRPTEGADIIPRLRGRFPAASVVVLGFLTVGCDDPAAVIRPTPPTALADMPMPRVDVTSRLDVPIRLDLAILAGQLDAHVPRERVWEDISVEADAPPVSLALTRGGFDVDFAEDVATVSTTVAYALRTRYRLPLLPDMNASCGTDPDEPAPRMLIRLAGPVSVTSDWRLDSEVRVDHVGPATDLERDRCEVTLFGVDVTERVASAGRDFLTDHESTIDSIVGSYDLASHVAGWWETLTRPVRLGEGLWLDLAPETVALGGLDGNGPVLEILTRLSARPRIVFGPRPAATATPLPDAGRARQGRSFRTAVHVLVGYEELGALITSELDGELFQAGGRSLRVDRVSVSGRGGNQIVVSASISGDARGTLYMVGTPTYSTSEEAVRLPDLTMSLETSNLLVAGASWVLDAGIEGLLRERVRWPAASGVSWAEVRLHEGLNATIGDGLQLRGTVDELVVVGVAARTDGLLIETRAAGRAELLVGDPG